MTKVKQIKQQSFSDMQSWLVAYLKGIDLIPTQLKNVNAILDTYEGKKK
ncbi:hypothetical protein LCGC14_0351800 [marine sediment metagenome]|uniref:Uncharacterized protein n=1 Tax=marine sediment metagenome TaxID=412755 RepID=A0A0F9VY25_9ZZZZ